MMYLPNTLIEIKKEGDKKLKEFETRDVRGIHKTGSEDLKEKHSQSVPGSRTEYIPALSGDAKPLLSRYQELYDADPFAEETFEAGEVLMAKMAEDRTARWCNIFENLDMKVNSRRTWKTLKNLSGDATKPARNFIPVAPDQVATQLLLNGKTKGKKPKEHISTDLDHENNSLGASFSMTELVAGIKGMKPNRWMT
ncbi:hypothetical protein QE152_g40202 [Popillia japonica]|uniref:Uncharacterized protein n=1 Tax=Popillia japonica TaxID=7064 RepID=A0AAW1HS30_POPJA